MTSTSKKLNLLSNNVYFCKILFYTKIQKENFYLNVYPLIRINLHVSFEKMTSVNNDVCSLKSHSLTEEISRSQLHLAIIKQESIDVIETILKDVPENDIHIRDKYGYTPLHLALTYPPGNLDVIRILLKCGASVNEKNMEGQTPLHLSLKHEIGIDVIKELLHHGADINAKNSFDETPLQMALNSIEDNFDIIKELLSNGANVHDKNDAGQTLLHIAIEKQKGLDVIQELLKFEVEVNIRDNNNVSPLHLALNSSWKTLEVIRELLNYGASVDEKITENRTPLHIAIENENNVDVISELLKYGADVNSSDIYQMTPLFVALSSFSDNLDVVRTLFEYGALVNERNIKGQSPLHVAIKSAKSLEIVQELLKQGAEVNIKDIYSETPLKLAINRTPINFRIIQELLSHGASVHEKGTSSDIRNNVLMKRNMSLGVLQELLKYALIEHSNFEKCTFCNILYSNCPYSKYYKNEVDKMKKIYVLDQLTLYDFVVHKYDYDKLYMRELDELSKFTNFPDIMQKEYPLYYDIITNIIETRAYLLRKLCDYSVFIVIDKPSHKCIRLNSDCLSEIGKYLSRNDLRNFIKAIDFKKISSVLN